MACDGERLSVYLLSSSNAKVRSCACTLATEQLHLAGYQAVWTWRESLGARPSTSSHFTHAVLFIVLCEQQEGWGYGPIVDFVLKQQRP